MLIRNAEIYQTGNRDIRIQGDTITEIGTLSPLPGEHVIEAAGGALIPGLNDHHIHFLSYAASLSSIDCSPSQVGSSEDLVALLKQAPHSESWLRGIGYHESVAGEIDRFWLDRCCPDRPVRIQHRTGRLWIFNSCGLDLLQQAMASRTEASELPSEGLKTGRFFDADQILGPLLGRTLPPVKLASARLASYGITGFSDMTPSNDEDAFTLFDELIRNGSLLQEIQVARREAFQTQVEALIPGPVKIHLHESRLPELDELVERIRTSHQLHVPIVIHCVTEVELLFALAALEEAHPMTGDRIEHASITPSYIFERLASMDITVVSQPQFILEKGDTYLRDLNSEEHPFLYRCKTFLDWGIAFAGSSDAPFGNADPWSTMRAAISRSTRSGQPIGQQEALTPEQALALFLGSLSNPGTPQNICVGKPAELCLLTLPWHQARTRLFKEDVRMVFAKGKLIHQSQESLGQETLGQETLCKEVADGKPYGEIASISPQSRAV